jgi:hypothetical protein
VHTYTEPAFVHPVCDAISIYARPEQEDSYRTTPTMRLLDSRSARGSEGCEISPHSCAMSAVRTERRGSFLKDDLAPSVAANLVQRSGKNGVCSGWWGANQRRPKPLSRRERSSLEKNMTGKSNDGSAQSYRLLMSDKEGREQGSGSEMGTNGHQREDGGYPGC